jgi:predicted enzyme related to lactoylglutathione lyase
MHRSRIGVILIDHPKDTYREAAAFWAGVTGSTRADPHGPAEDDPYESLNSLAGLHLDLQRTGTRTAPRVHLDIETDDVPAEVARVCGLGAKIMQEHQGYVVLADPGGLVFCVVPVQTEDFASAAQTWE